MNRVLGQRGVNDFGDLGDCPEFLSVGDIVEQDGLFLVIVVRNGDAPEGKLISSAATSSNLGVLLVLIAPLR